MSNITIKKIEQLNSYDLGAIVCRTPKTLNDTIMDEIPVDNRCVIVSSAKELVYYFGNPFINPSEYADLIIAYNLASNGIPVCVSSVYDMRDNDDGFDIHYNGYTRFVFKDSNEEDIVGYELKSNIKFCQPIIQSSYIKSVLTVYISLYLLDRDSTKTVDELNSLSESNLYSVVKVSFTNSETSPVTDELLISSLSNYGLELRVINSGGSATALVDKLMEYDHLNISLTNDTHPGSKKEYDYNLNSNLYVYGLSTDQEVQSEYSEAINRVANLLKEPNWLCLSKLYRSVTTIKNGNIVRSTMVDLDGDNYAVIQNILLSTFSEECNTYLFINSPDIAVSSTIDLISNSGDDKYSFSLLENYNCDLFFGYVSDFTFSSLINSTPHKVFYSASSLVFFNTIINNTTYLANGIANLGISNNSIKSVITKKYADMLQSARCNSLVTFDTGYPSTYGNRSLSLLSNLRYSNVSRNFIKLRKTLRDYLDSRKFSLNSSHLSDSIANYIKYKILNDYLDSGILSNYSIKCSSSYNEINVNISLLFNNTAQEIELNFII